ncbi:LacI family DNA-binding transcriptional regulator [Streptomyces qinglanensis]|uniref:LacI family transcriptional regulator n=1 Tax=Streptomyces qinglanensis TaxID=943816 RepID=A0A1H9SVT0_9ACTN|nr:LacI family DNA-binding transcriptional regulator [Streptomyces qinglanensis]SER89110.1 LacI family transcriptional regulator [Streptomyces qinglanensis]
MPGQQSAAGERGAGGRGARGRGPSRGGAPDRDAAGRTGADRGPGRNRPTGHDVAGAAGVSQATVSLVLGGKWEGRVSARTAEAVRAAARELGYRPNLAARTLRLGRTRTALLVVPALTNEFFATVHRGAADVAGAHDFGIVLYPSPEGVDAAPDPFASARTALDGVIASSMAPEALAALRGEGLPVVMLDSDERTCDATVNVDLADGMRQVVTHLLGLGHRRIAHISADVDSWTFAERARALHEELTAGGAALVRTERGALGVPGGLEAATRALTAHRDGADRDGAAVGSGARRNAAADRSSPAGGGDGDGPPTALVCDDDLLAAGALKAARRLGLRVPDDVSVTGFDDLALATAVEPELTTVRLPAERVGAAGMRTLLDILEGRDPEAVRLPVRLVERGSTGPAPSPDPRSPSRTGQR